MRTILTSVALFAGTLALRLPLLRVPFERDEGEYAYIAWRLGFGELPYLDWVDQKPPGIFWIYRLALALPMDGVAAVHLVAAAVSALTAVALYFVARRFTGDGWAVAAASLFAILAADPAVQGSAANTELFLLLPLVLAQLAFLRAADQARGRVAWIVASGAFTGLAIACKPVAATQAVLFVALWPVFVPAEGPLRRSVAFGAWLALGAAAVWLPIVAWFQARGALGEMIFQVFTHNLAYAGSLPLAFRAEALVSVLRSVSGSQAVVWAAAAIGLVALARARRWTALGFLGGGLLAGGLGASVSGYYFPHYLQQVLPALAISAAIGAWRCSEARVLQGLPERLRAALALVALAILPLRSLAPVLLAASPAEAVDRIYPGNSFAQMPALAERLAEKTGPDDRVFIFGAEAELLFYAQRASASRYIYLFPLFGPYADAAEKQKATAEEVTRARPAAIVLVPNALFSLPGSDPWLAQWVETYVRDGYDADAFLSMDPTGGVELHFGTDGQPARVPFGRTGVAGLYLRRAD